MMLELVLLVLFGTLTGYSDAGPLSTLDKLTDTLLEDYNKINIPNYINGINVTHGMTLVRVVSLEDDVMTLDTWMNNEWVDERLTWNPADFDGIDEIHIPSNLIWQPDITLYTSASQLNTFPGKDINAIIKSDGTVTLIPQVELKAYCPVKAKSVERHSKVTCLMKIGSWTYHKKYIDIYPKSDSIDDSSLVPNPMLKYKSSSVERNVIQYNCCPEMYVYLKYLITIKLNDGDEKDDKKWKKYVKKRS